MRPIVKKMSAKRNAPKPSKAEIALSSNQNDTSKSVMPAKQAVPIKPAVVKKTNKVEKQNDQTDDGRKK